MRRPPLGYRVMRRVELDDDEAATVRSVFEGIASGQTITDVARGHGLAPRQVRRMLTYQQYIGDEKFPQIIDTKLWDRAQAEIGRVQPYRR